MLLHRCRYRGEAGRSRGSARSGSRRVARVSVSARAPRSLAVLLDCEPPRLLLGKGEECPGPRASECPVLAGECVCACSCSAPHHPLAPRWGSWPFFPPPASLPGAACPNPNHLCTEETQLLPLRALGGRQGQGHRRRGGRHRLLPPCRLLPLPRLTLPPREGCLEGSGRPKPKPRSASYDQLGVCLLLPRAQVGEQASIQNMSEGGDGQGRGVGEDHHQRGRHAT